MAASSVSYDQAILAGLLVADECNFTSHGFKTFHSWHLWAEDNQRPMRHAHNKHRFSIRMLAGIIDRLIGPSFVHKNLLVSGTCDFSIDIYLNW
jgi:hypothetical protein